MPKYIYTNQYKYGNDNLEKLVFIKETATQIVAHILNRPDYVVRFNKSDGYRRGGDGWHPTKIISYPMYKELYNKKISDSITIYNLDIAIIQKKIDAAKAKYLGDEE